MHHLYQILRFQMLLTFYKDPACQDINPKDHCYASNPSCPPNYYESDEIGNVNNMQISIIIAAVIGTVLFLFSLWLVFCYKKTGTFFYLFIHRPHCFHNFIICHWRQMSQGDNHVVYYSFQTS